MESEENSWLAKLTLGDGKEILLLTTWKEKACHCLLFYLEIVWEAEVTESSVVSYTSHLSMDIEEYFGHLRDSFTNTKGFKYVFEDGSLCISRVLDSDFEVQFTEIPFRQVTDKITLSKIIGNLLLRNQNVDEELEKVKKEKAIADEELEKFVGNMEKVVKMKNQMEDTLYTKFLLLLNEKKKKIAELMNVDFEEEEMETVPDEPVEVKKEGPVPFSTKIEKLLDDDDDDEDIPKILNIPKRSRVLTEDRFSEPGPSTRH